MQTLLPSTGYLREAQLVAKNKKKPESSTSPPPAPALLPFSRSTLWNMVKEGRFPRPVKLGPRITAWRVEDIRDWMACRVAI